MGKETIFYRMGKSTLIYFVPEEWITGSRRNIKKRFWQKVKLPSFEVYEEELRIITVMVPELQNSWKRGKLLRRMHEVIAEKTMNYEAAEVVLKPEIQQMSGQEDAFLPIFWSLAGKQLDNMHLMKKPHGKRRGLYLESVVLLLGDTLFPEEQMQKFSEMMQPYFQHINHLTIVYEAGSDEGAAYDTDVIYKDGNIHDGRMNVDSYNAQDKNDEAAGYIEHGGMHAASEWEQDRWEEAVAEYTESLYYEYGLMASVQCGGDFRINRNSGISGQNIMLFLDFGYPGNIPVRALTTGDIYLDIFSSAKKEALLRRKCAEVSYMSPRKYLDTVVKSGYDKLVNQALPT